MEQIKEYYDDAMTELRYRWEILCRMFYWGWALRDNRDFDSGYLLQMEVLKLKRMLHLFENHGHHWEGCVNYEPKMKSLRLAVKLGERLIEGEYHQFIDLHEKKWGKLEYKFEESGHMFDGEATYSSVDYRNGKKVKLCQDERNEFLEAFLKDEEQEARHRRWFYAIIGKYGQYWWD